MSIDQAYTDWCDGGRVCHHPDAWGVSIDQAYTDWCDAPGDPIIVCEGECPSIRLTPTDATDIFVYRVPRATGVHRSGLHRLMRQHHRQHYASHDQVSIDQAYTDWCDIAIALSRLAMVVSIDQAYTDWCDFGVSSPTHTTVSVHRSGLHRLMRHLHTEAPQQAHHVSIDQAYTDWCDMVVVVVVVVVRMCPSIRLTPTDATGVNVVHGVGNEVSIDQAYTDWCDMPFSVHLHKVWGVHRSGLHRLMRHLLAQILSHCWRCPSIRLTPTDATGIRLSRDGILPVSIDQAYTDWCDVCGISRETCGCGVSIDQAYTDWCDDANDY